MITAWFWQGGADLLDFLTPLQELDKTRPDNAAGMSLVELLTLILLTLLWRRVYRSSYRNPIGSDARSQ
jgi:hypothetical protein